MEGLPPGKTTRVRAYGAITPVARWGMPWFILLATSTTFACALTLAVGHDDPYRHAQNLSPPRRMALSAVIRVTAHHPGCSWMRFQTVGFPRLWANIATIASSRSARGEPVTR